VAEKLKLKTIKEIIFEDKKFFIPSYQRGYRWDEQQVKDLLDDILEFFQNKRSKDEFYCLQPIVVRFDEKKKHYKVIDGQQRLTTIYIILKYLQESGKEFKKLKDNINKSKDEDYKTIFEYCDMEDFEVPNLYQIEYETRNKEGFNSKDFVENNLTKETKDNPDFYHISKAYQTVKEWFKSKPKKQFLETLSENTKVIWYEVKCKNEKEEIEIFKRLNIGKISLTNAELIKAKLLIPIEDYKTQIEFSSVWDNIEQTMQNDYFWYFLSNDKKTQTAIDLIFNVLAQKYQKEYNKKKKDDEKINYNEKKDEKFSYYVFEAILKHSFKDEYQIWKDAQQLFRTFLNWYNDRNIYHKIGYLINFETSLLSLVEKYENKTKDKFKDDLKEKIKNKIKDIDLINLKYQYDDEDKHKIKNYKEKIHNILLLFNIETILENNQSNVNFDFFHFKYIVYKDKEKNVKQIIQIKKSG